jgi:acyl-CoA dehydrogenase
MSLTAASLLLNPGTYDPEHFDAESRRVLAATIEHLEGYGLAKLTGNFHAAQWPAEFLDFVAKEKVFATFMTPARDAAGDENKRWDTARVAAMSEILGFYGLSYWYPWQVTCLGLGPVWQSGNDVARARAAAAIDAGGIGAFGLSEKEHGADIYSSDMVLTPTGDGTWTATGSKYYIGNGNAANTVSVFGRIAGIEGPDQYVFFYADSDHPAYHVVKNVVHHQNYVSEFRLEDYPVTADDILHTGEAAFSAALNTVNVGKFNLSFGSIGGATHALYTAITHAHTRVLYGKPVTAMPHIRSSFVENFARITAMKLFSYRAVDYFRCASADDRRYLLFNPVTKMKVTTEGERVVTALGDIVAAKGFEKDNFMMIAKYDSTGLPRLEGTVAVNLGLVLKFMPAYLFMPEELPDIPTRTDAADDPFLFNQGPARGLGKVRFQDWKKPYEAAAGIPNVGLFFEQAKAFCDLLITAAPDADQQKDLDFLLSLGDIFTLIVYGQLILEQAEILDLDTDIVDTIFEVLVRDFSAGAITMHGKAGANEAQRAWAVAAVRAPITSPDRFAKVWDEVAGLSGAYAMKD